MTRKQWLAIGCGAWLAMSSGSAAALTATLVKLGPLSSAVLAPFEVGLDISGQALGDLGNYQANSLRAFTLEIEFDELELDFLGVSFAPLCQPLPGPGDPECPVQTSFNESGGVVSLFENSLLSPISNLDALQSDAFRLATLTFQGLLEVEGTMISLIDDGDQELVLSDLTEGVLDSQPQLLANITPEPGTALLLGLGTAALALGGRRQPRA